MYGFTAKLLAVWKQLEKYKSAQQRIELLDKNFEAPQNTKYRLLWKVFFCKIKKLLYIANSIRKK